MPMFALFAVVATLAARWAHARRIDTERRKRADAAALAYKGSGGWR